MQRLKLIVEEIQVHGPELGDVACRILDSGASGAVVNFKTAWIEEGVTGFISVVCPPREITVRAVMLISRTSSTEQIRLPTPAGAIFLGRWRTV